MTTTTELRGRKILVTGSAGQIAFPIAAGLARDNEVWGLDLYPRAGDVERARAAGITPFTADLAEGVGDLPDDFDHVLHFAAYLGPSGDHDVALRIDAEGTGMLLERCRRARSAMVISAGTVCRPQADPWHPYREDDPLGEGVLPLVPTYSLSKIAEEAVARTCARMFDLPVVIARMNACYGHNGGMYVHYMDAVVEGRPIVLRSDPNPYSPIHERDVFAHIGPLLGAASVPANIVNWGGDEAVSLQEACAFIGELAGREPDISIVEVPGSHPGVVLDPTKRRSITGPCTVSWRDGLREVFEARYPEGPDGPRASSRPAAGSLHALEK
jgi:nucleoside-diphosphate-sugar epimerase